MAEGELKGMLKALRQFLRLKFGESGVHFADELQSVQDITKLEAINERIMSANSIDELRALLG
jgi:hypothetical protein